MRTEKPRFMLATLAVLAAVGLQSLAAAQERKVVPGNVKSAKPVDRDLEAFKAAVAENSRTPASLGIHGFSVVLVVGGTQATGAGASDTVPEAARKALADMKDFLPYKRYQLLDATWILCCGPESPIGKSQVSGRVRGPDSRDYLYTVDPGQVVGSKLNLRFVMRELQTFTPAMTGILSDTARLDLSRQHAEAIQELDESRLQLRTMKQRFDVGTATASEMESATARARRAEQRVRDLAGLLNDDQDRRLALVGLGGRVTSAASGARSGGGTSARGTTEIMDSSFSISPGETVVIGTSRLNGDQALIAILTAATKPGAGR